MDKAKQLKPVKYVCTMTTKIFKEEEQIVTILYIYNMKKKNSSGYICLATHFWFKTALISSTINVAFFKK